MNPEKTSRLFGLGAVLATLVWLLGTAIIFYWLYAVLGIERFPVYVPAVIFCGIDAAIIALIAIGAKALISVISVPSYIQLAFVTFLYSLLTFVGTGLIAPIASVSGFLLFALIVLFLYFAIVTPIVLFGKHHKNIKG